MVDEQVITQDIQRYVSENFLVDFVNGTSVDTDLFEADYIDSFGFVELVSFIESTYGITLDDDDLASPEIASVAGLTRLVVARRAGAARA